MNIKITMKKVEVPVELREEAKEKFSRLDRFNQHIQSIDLVIKAEDRSMSCEAIIKVDGQAPIIITDAAETIQGALDMVLEKAERQLRKGKERISVRRRAKGADQES